tara:strand:+ start:1038 stop:1322 length:285 start_codon:yes stop_codon:yes gene_type:complete
MSEPIQIPRKVDDPPHFLLWSADELAPIIIGLAIGMMFGVAFMMTVCGFVVTHFYKKFKDGHPDGFMLHALYWYGFMPGRGKSVRNPYSRLYLP